MGEGRVEAIFIAAEHGQHPHPVESATAVAGKGLEGNRYFDDGPARDRADPDRGRAARDASPRTGSTSTPRRRAGNVLTRGVDLNALVGRRFRVGEVECRGIELCEPCTTLEARTAPGAIKALMHRAGLNAEILVGGELRPGDAVAAL